MKLPRTIPEYDLYSKVTIIDEFKLTFTPVFNTKSCVLYYRMVSSVTKKVRLYLRVRKKKVILRCTYVVLQNVDKTVVVVLLFA